MWNELVATDSEASQRYNDILNASSEGLQSIESEIASIQAQIDIARDAIKTERKTARKSTHNRELQSLIDSLKAKRANLYLQKKTIREQVKSECRSELTEHALRTKAEVKAIRQKYAGLGLYWGTYNAIIQGYDTARSRKLKGTGDLRFHRFTGEGTWTSQIIGGMSVTEMFAGAHSQFSIDPMPHDAWSNPSRSYRRQAARTVAHIRIGTDEDKRPIMLHLPIVMHRAIPSNGRIKSIQVTTRKIASQYRWSLTVTVNLPLEDLRPVNGHAVAIDIGWRRKKSGVRVAYWIGTDGAEGEIALDESYVDVLGRVESLQSIRDERFNAVKAMIGASKETIPSELQEDLSTISQFRSQARLAGIVSRWKKEWSDTPLCAVVEAWRKQDKHLWLWQENLRDQMMNRRRDFFRKQALSLVSRYGTVVLEAFDLRPVKMKSTPEEGVDIDTPIRRIGSMAAAGMLRDCIKQVAAKTGATIVLINPANTTLDCPYCGSKIMSDPRSDIMVECGGCHKIYDQDMGACLNLLGRWMPEYSERCNDDQNIVTSRSPAIG
jgi:transposase